LIHYQTTGPEIWRDTNGGQFDIFISGVGTGGTITGVAKYLREQGWKGQVVAVEPKESSVLSGNAPGSHKIQGIGAGFKPAILELDLVDEVITVTSEEAITTAAKLPLQEGIFAGISSGAAVHAAVQLSERPENKGKSIVVILPSYGERYLSTILFSELKDKAAALPVAVLPDSF